MNSTCYYSRESIIGAVSLIYCTFIIEVGGKSVGEASNNDDRFRPWLNNNNRFEVMNSLKTSTTPDEEKKREIGIKSSKTRTYVC